MSILLFAIILSTLNQKTFYVSKNGSGETCSASNPCNISCAVYNTNIDGSDEVAIVIKQETYKFNDNSSFFIHKKKFSLIGEEGPKKPILENSGDLLPLFIIEGETFTFSNIKTTLKRPLFQLNISKNLELSNSFFQESATISIVDDIEEVESSRDLSITIENCIFKNTTFRSYTPFRDVVFSMSDSTCTNTMDCVVVVSNIGDASFYRNSYSENINVISVQTEKGLKLIVQDNNFTNNKCLDGSCLDFFSDSQYIQSVFTGNELKNNKVYYYSTINYSSYGTNTSFNVNHEGNIYYKNKCAESCYSGTVNLFQMFQSNSSINHSVSFSKEIFIENGGNNFIGGALNIDLCGHLDLGITHSSFKNNSVDLSYSSTGFGGAISIAFDFLDLKTSFFNCSFSGNIANTGGCIAIYNGLRYQPKLGNLEVEIKLNEFYENKADYGAAVSIFYQTNQKYSELPFFKVDVLSSIFKKNSAIYAAALDLYTELDKDHVMVNIDDCEFKYNSGERGSITGILSTMTITNTQFRANVLYQTAPSYSTQGGAIYAWKSNIIIDKKTTFNDNIADYGGACFFDTCDVSIKDSTFSGNYAYTSGAGIHTVDTGNFMIDETTYFSLNNAKYGGGISIYSFTKMEIDAVITKNTASIGGGGVYFLFELCSVPNCRDNIASNGNDTLSIPFYFEVDEDITNNCYLFDGGDKNEKVFNCSIMGVVFFDGANQRITTPSLEDIRITVKIDMYEREITTTRTNDIRFNLITEESFNPTLSKFTGVIQYIDVKKEITFSFGSSNTNTWIPFLILVFIWSGLLLCFFLLLVFFIWFDYMKNKGKAAPEVYIRFEKL